MSIEARTLLTVLGVEQTRPRASRFEVPDAKIIGLRLVVQTTGAKSWAVRYTIAGRDRKHTLGPFPRIGLEAARKLASAALRTVAEGRDPGAEKIEARRREQSGQDQTFGAVWDQYIAEYVKPNLKPRTAGEIERLAKTLLLPKLKRHKLSAITAADVHRLIDAQAKRGAPMQGNKVLATLRAFFNWCVGKLMLAASPCTGIKKPQAEQSRDRILDDHELAWLWSASDKLAYPFGQMVKILLLTGARRNEVSGMLRNEIGHNSRLFTIPKERSKNGREHEIYLSDLALSVLDSCPKVKSKAGFVFTTTGETHVTGFSRAKTQLDKHMAASAKKARKELRPWVLHDLRRTAASGMARLGVSLPVIERCLNHVSGSFAGIVGVYQRHEFADEKRAAFEKWGGHVAALVNA